MKFKIGEIIELIADDGRSCGEYTIEKIDGSTVYFTRSNFYVSSYPPRDLLRRCRKIIKPGQQLEFDW